MPKGSLNDSQRQSTICELTFPTTVLAVRLNRKRLVVVLEDQIYLYDISNMKLLYTIETSPNPNAIVALSPSSESCFLAYPLPQKSPPPPFSPSHAPHAPPSSTHIPPTSGDVLLFDALKLEAVNVAEAHRSPLSCIALNNAGTLLATASDKGTIIRVFAVPSARKLYQFRRGSMPSRISSMAFNSTSSLLCVSSASDTVHIFKLGAPGAGGGGGSGADGSRKDSSSSSKAEYEGSAALRRPDSRDSAAKREGSLSPAPSDSQSNLSRKVSGSMGAGAGVSAPDRKHNGTFMGMIRRTSQNVGTSFAASVGAYLPSAVSEMWEPARDFAWLKIPKVPPGGGHGGRGLGSTAPLRSVVAMSSNSPQVMVVTNEGRFYVFWIDLEKGGEGRLVKDYEISGENERLGGSEMDG
ncbi:MAG: hypothetical protein LQ342_001003 [Letrouitia transgressa]|nr:MAG: hypothetical protein LQ342_001003 [Letrouitia transgressa]